MLQRYLLTPWVMEHGMPCCMQKGWAQQCLMDGQSGVLQMNNNQPNLCWCCQLPAVMCFSFLPPSAGGSRSIGVHQVMRPTLTIHTHFASLLPFSYLLGWRWPGLEHTASHALADCELFFALHRHLLQGNCMLERKSIAWSKCSTNLTHEPNHLDWERQH